MASTPSWKAGSAGVWTRTLNLTTIPTVDIHRKLFCRAKACSNPSTTVCLEKSIGTHRGQSGGLLVIF
ncbi:hypothetical protein Hypma_006450 [Hypsizygus marmoreus]|uniref:Uncharacterized protein n=1 Tax=Hypsizygus marmoreus TaxID=39966 RepID=A0A369JTM8_HYPMA|nr:hypothetical protein Hypma_006450 [Hypsizygus marmoreus]